MSEKTASGLSKAALKAPKRERPRTVLAIPQTGELLPGDWWKDQALPALAGMDDPEEALEVSRRLAALGKYVKDREQRFELDAARIVAEMRIGELLGEPTPGRKPIAPVQQVSPTDRVRFRLLAEHRKLVLELIAGGIASRKRILARLQRQDPGERPVGIEVRHGDFRSVLADLNGKVDAIITDPPYPKEYLPLYADLSEVADALLRPGGICAVMVGQSYLPDVIASLGSHLSYRWTIAYMAGGAATALHARRVQSYWKPVLVYEKEPANVAHRIGGDVVRSAGGDTDPTYHGWGQNESGMLVLVERLTEPDDLIVDPFLGGGTTLVAAAAAGRHAVGCDIDAEAIEQATARLG